MPVINTGSWYGFASSADGTKLVTGNNNGKIYYSVNSGETWAEGSGAGIGNWYVFASSDDGSKLVTGKYGGYIYTSTDSGATWTPSV